MGDSELLLIACAVLYCFCMGASWMLQVVCYSTYALVGEKEFVPFHVSFGRRLLIVVIPMILTAIATFVLVFTRPEATPVWATLAVAVCSAVILGTTIILEVPKHMQLDKEGKSDTLIAALVRDNLPRTASWTLGSLLLAYMVVVTFGG